MNFFFVFSTSLFVPFSTKQVTHKRFAPLILLWKSGMERAGLTDTAMLITMRLSAKEKQGSECFVHLEGPLHG